MGELDVVGFFTGADRRLCGRHVAAKRGRAIHEPQLADIHLAERMTSS